MPSNLFSKNRQKQESIAIWGPTGAGKDWLFRSFRRELQLYNLVDDEFQYDISERLPGEHDPKPLDPTVVPSKAPTTQIEEYNYIFARTTDHEDEAHRISAQAHDIILTNNKGANLVDCLSDHKKFESTFQSLIHARNLILVLSIPGDGAQEFATEPNPGALAPPKEMSVKMDQPEKSEDFGVKMNPLSDADPLHSDDAQRQDWSRDEYYKFMQLLLDCFKNGQRRNLAVCMTKSDLLNLRGDALSIFEKRYGLNMVRLLERYANQHNIEVFTTSAVGYIKKGDRVVPNFENGLIGDEKLWRPVNTASPFFWIFEQIERERLSKRWILLRNDQIKYYIGYPEPRPF